MSEKNKTEAFSDGNGMTLEEKFQDLVKEQKNALALHSPEDRERLIDLQRMAFYYGAIIMQNAYDGTVQTSAAIAFRQETDSFKGEFV
jgi:hypothetical protein